jgi:hypothetical protein
MSNIVELQTTPDFKAVECAKELLQRCEAGETIAFTVVEELSGGRYRLGGSAVASRTQTAGMLLDAAISRLSTL